MILLFTNMIRLISLFLILSCFTTGCGKITHKGIPTHHTVILSPDLDVIESMCEKYNDTNDEVEKCIQKAIDNISGDK